MHSTYIMVNAHIDVLAAVFLFPHKTGRQTSATSIDDCATLFLFDRWMKTQVLSARQSKTSELLFFSKLLCSVLHESFELGKGFLDLGHSTLIKLDTRLNDSGKK